MKNNSGIMLKLNDGRKVIVFNNQPLLKEKGKIILNLINDDFNLITDDSGKPKIIIKGIELYNLENQEQMHKIIGYVD